MPKAKARSARTWGTRFDVISSRTSIDPTSDAASIASSTTADEEDATTTTTTTEDDVQTSKAPSESAFGGDELELSSVSVSSATATRGGRAGGGRSSMTGRAKVALNASTNSGGGGGGRFTTSGSGDEGLVWADESFNSNTNASWSADPLIPSSNPSHPQHDRTTHPHRRPHRWNHNASVFVASLPPEPNAALDTYIHDTLGKHGSILNIKFIHDIRSGNAANCAFVQFQYPEEAQAAIQACHMTFIQGRCIRCEPAKAHRTLLVSFCPSPSPTPLAEKEFTNIDIRTGLDPADKFPEWVRIRRPDSRTHFVVVSFNEVALGYTSDQPAHWTDAHDPLSGPGTLISLNNDVPKAETMRTLAEPFGPLELIRPFIVPSPEEVQGIPYAPHPVSAGEKGMDASTYEIKWEQRQDAISALYSLARIPNLIVTWAHEHPHPNNYYRHGQEQGGQFQAQYPAPFTESGTQDTLVDEPTMTVSYSKMAASPSKPRIGIAVGESPIRAGAGAAGKKKNTAPTVDDFPPLPISQSTPRRLGVSEEQDEGGMSDEALNVSTEVVPPLSHRGSPTPSELDAPVVSDFEDDTILPHARPSSELMLSPETPTFFGGGDFATSASRAEITPSSTTSAITPSPQFFRVNLPLPTQSAEYVQFKQRDPTTTAVDKQQFVPDSLFIGGLDPAYGWTEKAVREVFGKYGEVIAVRLVFKGGEYAGPGHCFVKFRDDGKREAVLAHAIASEDGRVYGMRNLRVSYSLPPHLKGPPMRRARFPPGGLGLQGMAGSGSPRRKDVPPLASPITPDSPAGPWGATDENANAARAEPVLAPSESAPAALTRLGHRATQSPLTSIKPLDDFPTKPTDVTATPSTISPAAGASKTPRRRPRAKSDPTTPTRGERAAAVEALFTQANNRAALPYPAPQFAMPPPFFAYPPEMYWNAAAAAAYGMQLMYSPPPSAGAPAAVEANPAATWQGGFWGPHAHAHGIPPFAQPPQPSSAGPNHSGTSTPVPHASLQPTGFVQSENGLFVPSYAYPPEMMMQMQMPSVEQNSSRPQSSLGDAPSPAPGAPSAWPGAHHPYALPGMPPVAGNGMVPGYASVPSGAHWDPSSQMHAPAPRPPGPFVPPHAMNPFVMGGMPGFVPASAPAQPGSSAPSPMPAHANFRPRPLQANKRGSDSSHSANKDSSGPPSFPAMLRAGGRQISSSSSSSSSLASAGGMRPSNSFAAMGPRSMMPPPPPPLPTGLPNFSAYPSYMPYDPAAAGTPPYGVPMPAHPIHAPSPASQHLQASKSAPQGLGSAQAQWNVLPAAYDNP